MSVTLQGAVDSGDSNHVTQAETLMRRFALECADRLRRSAPGCERCYALAAPVARGRARGGPCIDGEYTLTVEDHERGARFDDVLFMNVHEGRPPHAGAVEGCDVPTAACCRGASTTCWWSGATPPTSAADTIRPACAPGRW